MNQHEGGHDDEAEARVRAAVARIENTNPNTELRALEGEAVVNDLLRDLVVEDQQPPPVNLPAPPPPQPAQVETVAPQPLAPADAAAQPANAPATQTDVRLGELQRHIDEHGALRIDAGRLANELSSIYEPPVGNKPPPARVAASLPLVRTAARSWLLGFRPPDDNLEETARTRHFDLVNATADVVASMVFALISSPLGVVLTLYLSGGWLKMHGGHCRARRVEPTLRRVETTRARADNTVFFLMLVLYQKRQAGPLLTFVEMALVELDLPIDVDDDDDADAEEGDPEGEEAEQIAETSASFSIKVDNVDAADMPRALGALAEAAKAVLVSGLEVVRRQISVAVEEDRVVLDVACRDAVEASRLRHANLVVHGLHDAFHRAACGDLAATITSAFVRNGHMAVQLSGLRHGNGVDQVEALLKSVVGYYVHEDLAPGIDVEQRARFCLAPLRDGEDTHQATVAYDLRGWRMGTREFNATERLNGLYLRAALGPLVGALVGSVALVTSPSLADVETGRTGRLVLPSIVPTFDYDPEAQLRDTLAADVAVARTTLSALDATKRLIAERRLSRRQALLDAPGVAARRAAEAERRAAEMAAHMQQFVPSAETLGSFQMPTGVFEVPSDAALGAVPPPPPPLPRRPRSQEQGRSLTELADQYILQGGATSERQRVELPPPRDDERGRGGRGGGRGGGQGQGRGRGRGLSWRRAGRGDGGSTLRWDIALPTLDEARGFVLLAAVRPSLPMTRRLAGALKLLIAYVDQEPNHSLVVRSEMEARRGVDDIFIYHPNSTHAVRLDGGDAVRPERFRANVSILVAHQVTRGVAAVCLRTQGPGVRNGHAYMLVRPKAGSPGEYEPAPEASGVLLFVARS